MKNKIPFAVLAGVFTATTIVAPTPGFAAEDHVLEAGLYFTDSTGGQGVFYNFDAWVALTPGEQANLIFGYQPENIQIYVSVQSKIATLNAITEAGEFLTASTDFTDGDIVGSFTDVAKGEDFTVGEPPVVAPVLTVKSVTEINNAGVSVTIEATEADDEEANVEVKDNEGNVVPTEATLVAEGSETAEFAFVTPFADDYEFTGVWSVNGENFSFDAINQLADIIEAAVTNPNQIKLQAALDAAGITYADEVKIQEYLEALDAAQADLVTLADVQKVIDGVDEASSDLAADGAKVKAVVDAKTQKQLLDALTANFELVNPAWIVNYSVQLLADGDFDSIPEDQYTVIATTIQTFIYETNADAIEVLNLDADGNLLATTAAEQVKITALFEAWLPADEEDATDKADAIYESKKAEAQFKIAEAKTATTLYNALVAYANFIADEVAPEIKVADLNVNNKAAYWTASDFAEPTSKAAFVTAIQASSADVAAIIVAGNAAPGVEALAKVNNAETADALLAALKAYPNIKNVADSNKDIYYGTDNDFALATDIQSTVDDKNLEAVQAAVGADKLLVALKALGLKNVVDANKAGYEAEDFSQASTAEAQALVDSVNIVAGVNNATTALEVATALAPAALAASADSAYLELTAAAKQEVAELFFAIKAAERTGATDGKYTTIAGIKTDLGVVTGQHTDLLDGVNGAATITEMRTALAALEIEAFDNLDAAAQLDAAEAFLSGYPVDAGGDRIDYTTIAAIKAAL